MSSIPKNRGFLLSARPSHMRQSVHFQKITGTLKMNILFWKFAETFLLHQRKIGKKNSKLEFFQYFLIFSKIVKTVYDLKNSKTNFLGEFLFIFSF